MSNQLQLTTPVSVSRYREPKGYFKVIVILLFLAGIFLSIIQIFFILASIGIPFFEISYFYALFAAFLPPVFLYFPAHKKCRKDVIPWYDYIFFTISLFGFLFLSYHGFTLFSEGWMFTAPIFPTILGILILLLALEAIRRAAGTIFFIISFLFLFFPTFAASLPSPFTGLEFSLIKTMRLHSMGTESLLGIPIKVIGNLLIGFIIFGAAMAETGGGKFFLNFSFSLLGHMRGGPAKVAVIASGIFGSLSGSVVSNVLTTGCMTIPAMKKLGYPSHYAGAIEACASTGGVLAPPVMGATAFIMAMFLNIPYLWVAIAAAIPSFLYYIGLLLQVDAYAAKKKIKGLPKEELPSFKETIKEGWYYIFAFFLLIWFVAYLRLEAQAPFYASGALILLSQIRKETRFNIKSIIQFIENIGRILSELTATLCGVSFIIGALTITGVSSAFASEMVRLAGGNLYLLLLFCAITSLILGTGMTITACYVFLALMVGPVLIDLGINPIAAHLFILYYGMISYITPPVAIGSFAAASIAEASAMKTGIYAVRLGIVTFFIPFFFVLNPSLILQSSVNFGTIYTIVTAIFGIMLIGGSLEGYMWGLGEIRLVCRIIGVISGFLITMPGLKTDIYGGVIALIGLFIYFLGRKNIFSFNNLRRNSKI